MKEAYTKLRAKDIQEGKAFQKPTRVQVMEWACKSWTDFLITALQDGMEKYIVLLGGFCEFCISNVRIYLKVSLRFVKIQTHIK